MRVFVVGIASVVLLGCATAPVPSASPDVKPASSILDGSAVIPRPGAGAIVVTRDKGLAALACTFDVAIDGKAVAGLRAGEQVTLYADTGERILGVSVREGYCGKGLAQIAVQVVENATKKVRVGVDASLDIRLEQSAY